MTRTGFDANGLYGFLYNGTPHYYVYNGQGDVVRLISASGATEAMYTYDAWGKPLSVTDASGNAISDASHIANVNPLRYRGYYYDVETGFYYLQSRYYDPEVGRFINADGYISTGQGILGYNMFAYCLNNPIMFVDFSGLCAMSWSAGYQGPCPGVGMPGCMDKIEIVGDVDTILAIDKKSPPDHPGYIPPKKGGPKLVKNPNGFGWGWQAKDGGVWVPDPDMHGGEGWTVQYPGGEHSHAYPGGKVRNHFRKTQSTTKSIIMVFFGAIVTVGLVVDDLTGIGVADDPLLVASTACVFNGFNGLFEEKTCEICGAVSYGF